MVSRLGLLVISIGMLLFVYRLIFREEAKLLEARGQSYRRYLAAVPRLVPAWIPRLAAAGAKPDWMDSFRGEIFMVGDHGRDGGVHHHTQSPLFLDGVRRCHGHLFPTILASSPSQIPGLITWSSSAEASLRFILPATWAEQGAIEGSLLTTRALRPGCVRLLLHMFPEFGGVRDLVERFRRPARTVDHNGPITKHSSHERFVDSDALHFGKHDFE